MFKCKNSNRFLKKKCDKKSGLSLFGSMVGPKINILAHLEFVGKGGRPCLKSFKVKILLCVIENLGNDMTY